MDNQLTVTECGVKAKSKIEVYRVLTTEGGVYLPPPKECNYKFVQAIITGTKRVCLSSLILAAHKRERREVHKRPLLQGTHH